MDFCIAKTVLSWFSLGHDVFLAFPKFQVTVIFHWLLVLSCAQMAFVPWKQHIFLHQMDVTQNHKQICSVTILWSFFKKGLQKADPRIEKWRPLFHAASLLEVWKVVCEIAAFHSKLMQKKWWHNAKWLFDNKATNTESKTVSLSKECEDGHQLSHTQHWQHPNVAACPFLSTN